MLATTKNQVSVFWKKQSKPQRITLLALLIAGLVLVPALILWASKPSYSVAFSGLSEADAGEIVQKLDDAKTPYTLGDNGKILVPSDQVYQVRLKMAKDGLPKSSTVGYELLDGNMLGMTDFLQKVDYQRAVEGELARTIGSISSVETAQVHIVTPEKALLTSEQNPATASITIKVKQGQVLDAAQVRAITHLVASSIESLKPENVVVVDTDGNLLSGVADDGTQTAVSQSDDQRAAEVAASAEVKKRVQSMLDKVLGPNRYTVQASVLLDWNQKEVTSSVFDPTPAAVRSSHVVDETYNTSGGMGGVPGAGSNLPTPIPSVVPTGEAGTYHKSDVTMNYEITQTETREKVQPGQVKQISLAIMVNKVDDPAQLASIKSAAAAAAGIDAKRGDQVVVESIAFDTSYYDTQNASLDTQQKQSQYIQIGMGVAAVLLLVGLMIYFQKSLTSVRNKSAEGWRPILKPVGELAGQSGGQMYAAPAGKENGYSAPMSLQNLTGKGPDDEAPVDGNIKAGNPHYAEDDQKSRVIQRLTEESPATVAEIIQIWLNEDERKNA